MKNWNLCTLNFRAETLSLDFTAVFPHSWLGKVRFYLDTIPSTIPRPPVKKQTKVRSCQQAGVIKHIKEETKHSIDRTLYRKEIIDNLS